MVIISKLYSFVLIVDSKGMEIYSLPQIPEYLVNRLNTFICCNTWFLSLLAIWDRVLWQLLYGVFRRRLHRNRLGQFQGLCRRRHPQVLRSPFRQVLHRSVLLLFFFLFFFLFGIIIIIVWFFLFLFLFLFFFLVIGFRTKKGLRLLRQKAW